MIEKKIIMSVSLSLLLSGCLNVAESDAKKVVRAAAASATKENKNYKSFVKEGVLDNISKVSVANLENLKDPFKIKEFFEDKKYEINKNPSGENCKGDSAPADHNKSYLESYSLNDLSFVGMIAGENAVALVKTPKHGVVSVKKGDYIGNKNGIVSYIAQRKMFVLEKALQGCRWRDLKTVLSLK